MALLNKETRWLGLGVAVGLGVRYLAPFFAPALATMVKPLTKATVKASWVGLERGRELASHLVETVQDALDKAN